MASIHQKGEESCDTEMKDDNTLSEISDMGSQIVGEIYTLQEINDFLEMTFGKIVDMRCFVPDAEKCIVSVLLFQRTVSYVALDKKRFRLKNPVSVHYTSIRIWLL